MQESDFIDFLTIGHSLNDVLLNDSVERVIKLHGPPTEKIGDEKCGFLQYERGIRYGYFEDEIDDLAIIFFGKKGISIIVKNDYGETFSISEKTLIHRFIYMLNSKGIEWRCNDERNPSVFSIRINRTYVLFELETGRLVKIARTR